MHHLKFDAAEQALAADSPVSRFYSQLRGRAAEAQRQTPASFSTLLIALSIMTFDYPTAIGSLTPEQRLRFYEVFAHNLTVCVRAIWSDDRISDTEKVDRLKWLNEISHRITGKIGVLRLNLHEWTESDTWEMIQGYVERNKNIGSDVGWAIKTSYESIAGNAGRV